MDKVKGKAPDPEVQEGCVQAVTNLFPDICLSYLAQIAAPLHYDSDAVINHIIDLSDKGASYRRRPHANNVKRKRKRSGDDNGDDDDEDDGQEVTDAKRKYWNQDEKARDNRQMTLIRKLITGDFPLVHCKDVQKLLIQHGRNVLPTYLVVAGIVREEEPPAAEPWKKKKRPTVQEAQYKPANIDNTISECRITAEKEILQEFRAARLILASRDRQKRKHLKKKEDEQKDYDEAKASGQLVECECCFAEFAKTRLVNCNGESSHSFCIDCARRNAETLVGLSKYELTCMSTDGCEAGFSHAQRTVFLDKKLMSALDRIEQEAVLRMANIENLANCPFCPYAAECPPVEDNREFHCENPTCCMISCRLCNAESHVPQTCQEAAIERGVPARREIEEAMTAAIIRKCNKCSTPFIKDSGCNKMKCSTAGCKNTQCYVCSKSCDYSHFNDASRGGKTGNCPLFDVTEARHQEEVQNAEVEARKRVAELNPDVNPELLAIRMSDKVTQDDARRRQTDPFVNQGELYMNGALIPAEGPAAAPVPRRGGAQQNNADEDNIEANFGQVVRQAEEDLRRERQRAADYAQRQARRQQQLNRLGPLMPGVNLHNIGQPRLNPQFGPPTRFEYQRQLQRAEADRIEALYRQHFAEQRQAAQLLRERQAQRQAEERQNEERVLNQQMEQQWQLRQQRRQREWPLGMINPNAIKNVVPFARNAGQGEQPQLPQFGGVGNVPDWLQRLHALDVGFGPMQAMDFGRATGINDPGQQEHQNDGLEGLFAPRF